MEAHEYAHGVLSSKSTYTCVLECTSMPRYEVGGQFAECCVLRCTRFSGRSAMLRRPEPLQDPLEG